MDTFRVLITSKSFGSTSEVPLRTLEEAGLEVTVAPGDPGPDLGEYDALIVSGSRLTREVLAAARPRLKLVAKIGAGLDTVDVEAAHELGIAVTNTPGANAGAVADLTMALLLDCSRHVTRVAKAVEAGEWKPRMGVDVFGKTIGIVGFGAIGREVAKRARGFDMEILAYDPLLERVPEAFEGWVELVGNLDELMSRSNCVTVHTPLLDSTRNLIGAHELSLMPPDSVLVNAARGGVVDEEALVEALKSGHLHAAAADTTLPEPMPPDHPFRGVENMLVTPHAGMYSKETSARISQICADNVVACAHGEELRFVV